MTENQHLEYKFDGYSIPRNKEVMRVFRDLDMVEYLGSGMPRILRAYPRDCFTFSANFLRITLPMAPEAQEMAGLTSTLEKTPEKILHLFGEHPEWTLAQVAEQIGKSNSAVERAAAKLQKENRLKRVGPAKGGHWELLT
jgi:predicted HTH transcriptional regulator